MFPQRNSSLKEGGYGKGKGQLSSRLEWENRSGNFPMTGGRKDRKSSTVRSHAKEKKKKRELKKATCRVTRKRRVSSREEKGTRKG